MLCGGTLNATASAHNLTSPSFPAAYPEFTSCRWILDAPPQETIQVSVHTFALDPSQSCATNYLEINDWPVVSVRVGSTQRLGAAEFCSCRSFFFSVQGDFGQSHKYCPSDEHPLDFYSYGRTVLVHFKSDAFMAGNGLNITFQIAG